MAYLIFKNEINKAGQSLPKSETSFIRAAKTESDLNIVSGGKPQTVSTISISDSDYDDMADGSKCLILTGDVPSFVDSPYDGFEDISEEAFKNEIEDYRSNLLKVLNTKSNHSQIGRVSGALDYITNLDISEITFPTKGIIYKLRQVDKYINLDCV